MSLFELGDAAALLKDYPFIDHVQVKLQADINDARMRLGSRLDSLRQQLPDVGLSFHAYPLINLCETVQEIRQHWVRLAQDVIKCCWDNGGEFVVLHAGYAQGNKYPHRIRKKALLMLADSLDELLETAKEYDVDIHIENIYPAPFRSELVRVMDRKEDYDYIEENIQDNSLFYCFDYGHAMIDDRGLEIYDSIQSRIKSIHLHDNDRCNDLHLAIGDGPNNTLAWEKEINKIINSGFDGYLILENGINELENALDFTARTLQLI